MKKRHYQVFGTGTPALLGRTTEVAEIRRQWRNNHASVIGPKFFGKSILLHHLARIAKEDEFTDVVYWNMRQPVPETEQEFYALFHEHLRDQSPSIREYLKGANSDETPEVIHDAFEFLQADGLSVLVVMQSMDEMLLRGDSINPNLWDRLATLAELDSIRFLLSSRRKLIELVPSQQAKLSDFWRRIGCVRPVGTFKSSDFDHLLAPLIQRGMQFDASARKELMNWTGGIPPLLIGLCAVLEQQPDGTALSKAHVDAAAKKIDARCVDELWADLSTDVRERYAELAEKKSLPRNQCEPALFDELRMRGLAVEERGQLKPASRLLEEHANSVVSANPEFRRLFGDAGSYLPNLRRVLELRVVQVASDPRIKSHLNSIFQVLDDPDAATKMLCGIFDRCADIILAEMKDGKIPEEWIRDWDESCRIKRDERGNVRGQVEIEIMQGRIPNSRGGKTRLLELLRDGSKTKARASTICLLDVVKKASDYCRHASDVGETVPLSFACSALFAALELCGQLSEDFRHEG